MSAEAPRTGALELAPGPTRAQAAADILLFIGAALAFYAVEEMLRRAGMFPFPAVFDGIFSLIGSFIVAAAILNWRGQSWRDIGLRRSPNWWWIPVWAFLTLVVNMAAQNTLVPALAGWLELDPPDMSRYDIIRDNLPMLFVVMTGAMITGGFMEEFLYRGVMIDRLARLFGGGRSGLLLAALLNGLPFGVIHFEWGPGGILLTVVMGSVLGVMYLAAKRNLWPMIAAHAILDALLITLLYFGITP
jgi:membrane protease YdiL (CAAX protease family)